MSASSAPSAAADVTFSNTRGEPSTPRSSTSHDARTPSPSQDSQKSNHGTPSTLSRSAPRSGGFLLETAFGRSSPRGVPAKKRPQEANAKGPRMKRRDVRAPSMSEGSSIGGSPLSRQLSANQGDEEEPTRQPSSRVDTAQLVRMALDLSESRKRNLSGSAPIPVATSRNTGSGMDSKYGSLRSTRSGDKRSSQLRSEWQDDSPRDSGHIPLNLHSDAGSDNHAYDFSPATLSRAEKARKYFELADEHRRLLQRLPPILNKPQESTSRSYNPLQAIRNRRLRTREKRPYTVPVEAWQDLDTVRAWLVDSVDAEDGVLPPFPGDDSATGKIYEPAVVRHRRTDTVSSTIMRPQNGWSVDPAELLADTYWTEQRDNKSLIEDRRGNQIFPQNDRQSAELDRLGSEDEDEDSGRLRKRAHLFPKHIPRPSRSASTSSASSGGGWAPAGYEEKTGPLERHMEQMIAKDERGELSPATVSPDKWDSRHKPFPQDHSAEGGPVSPVAEDGMISDEPNSPIVAGSIPAMGMDLSPPPKDQHKSRFNRFPMFRPRSKERNNIDQTDFAANQPGRSSMESAPRSSLQRRHRPTESWSGGSLRRYEMNDKDRGSRFLRGGRIGELVRNEAPRKGDDSDTESTDYNTDGRMSRDSEPSPRTSLDRGRTRPRYHLPNLPSFRSPVVETDSKQSTRRGKLTIAHSSAPTTTNNPADDRRRSYGFSGPLSPSSSQDSLASLGSPDPESVPHSSRPKPEKRHWSISDRHQSEASNKVTLRDIARVRALLLSSGIKAHEIQRAADQPRDQPLRYIQKISELVEKPLHEVPRKQEHKIAARALTEDLSSTLAMFRKTLNRFQDESLRSLRSEMEDLQCKAGDRLTKLVHETSDEADAFTVELTTKQPQDIKRIDDAIDDMLRRRRRQFRVLRRVGFKLLEWLVVCILWWLWMVVTCFNVAKKTVVGVASVVRWLVWI